MWSPLCCCVYVGIGKGKFSTVYRARVRDTGVTVALKKIQVSVQANKHKMSDQKAGTRIQNFLGIVTKKTVRCYPSEVFL